VSKAINMTTGIARRQTPEELELEKKKAELSVLEAELSQRELELATLQAELRAFERRYLRVVGIRYAELDEVEAQIAETLARRKAKDSNAQQRAAKARAKAQESAEAAGAARQEKQQLDFAPSDSLKKLYREIAKRIHPDLTTDEKERGRRNQVMAEANRAYEQGDEAKLRQILDEWESSPDTVKGEGAGAELVRVIRKIHQVQTRFSDIAANLVRLKQSELWQMKKQVEEAAAEGRDLLKEMADRLEREIEDARIRLDTIGADSAKP
jgi:hypothetical protein